MRALSPTTFTYDFMNGNILLNSLGTYYVTLLSDTSLLTDQYVEDTWNSTSYTSSYNMIDADTKTLVNNIVVPDSSAPDTHSIFTADSSIWTNLTGNTDAAVISDINGYIISIYRYPNVSLSNETLTLNYNTSNGIIRLNNTEMSMYEHSHAMTDIVGLTSALNDKEDYIIPSTSADYYFSGDKTWKPLDISTIGVSTSASTGLLSDTDWNTFNNKGKIQIPSDYDQIDTSAVDYIKNKPDLTVYTTKGPDGVLDETLMPAMTMTTGLISGGKLSLTSGSDHLINISSGAGYIVDNYTNPDHPPVHHVTWDNMTDIETPFLNTADTSYLAIGLHGNLEWRQDPYMNEDMRDFIVLGWIDHSDRTTVGLTFEEPYWVGDSHLQLLDFMLSFGPFNISGNDVLISQHFPMRLGRTGGTSFFVSDGKDIHGEFNRKNPNIVTTYDIDPCEFQYYWREGTEWFNGGTLQEEISGLLWDNNGVVEAVPGGMWTIQPLMTYPPLASSLDIQYGQKLYVSMEAALSGINDIIDIDPYNIYDIFRGWLILRNDCTDLHNTASALLVRADRKGIISNGGASGGATGSNTASNIGTLGIGLYDRKVGVDLQFRNIANADGKINIYYDETTECAKIDLGTVTKDSIQGVENVDNTSDVNKPISSATAYALDNKEDSITSASGNVFYKGDKTFSTIDYSYIINTPGIVTSAKDGIMTSSEHNKLLTIDTSANYYVHPSNHPATIITEDNTHRFVTDTQINNWNNTSAVTNVPIATSAVAGIVKIGANVSVDTSGTISVATPYVHPVNHPPSIITQDSSNRFVTDLQILNWNSATSGTATAIATTAVAGIVKIGANVSVDTSGTISVATPYVHPATHPQSVVDSTSGWITSALSLKEASVTIGTSAQYYRGDKSWQTLDKNVIGLGNVDNTSDINKPVSSATSAALLLKSNTTHSHNTYALSDVSSAIPLDTQILMMSSAVGKYVPVNSITIAASNGSASTGTLSYSGMTINANPAKFDIGALSGSFADNTLNPLLPTIVYKSFAPITAITLTSIATQNASYIAIDKVGNIIQQGIPYTPTQTRDYIPLGTIVHSNRTSINAINNAPHVVMSPGNQLSDLEDAIGQFNVSGNKIVPNGANLNINKTSGEVYKQGSNFANDVKNPNTLNLSSLTAPSNIRYRLRNGTEYTDRSTIDPANYDFNGVLTSTGGNTTWSIQRVYLFQSNLIRIQYGQVSYSSYADAVNGINTEDFIVEQNLYDNGIIRALILVKHNATVLNNTAQAVIMEVGKFGGTVGMGSISTTTLQVAYNNSTTPEIVTSTTLGALSIKRGSTLETDHVLEIINGSDIITATICGDGTVTTPLINISSIPSTASSATDLLIRSASGYVEIIPKSSFATSSHIHAQSDITSSSGWITSALSLKEASVTIGTSAQYYRGDKSFQTLNTLVVPEVTNLYYLDSRVKTYADTQYQTTAAMSNYETTAAHNNSLVSYQTTAGMASYQTTAAMSNYATSASLATKEPSISTSGSGYFFKGTKTWSLLADTDIPNLNTSKITSGVFGTSFLGSGSATSGTYLRGDGTWSTPSGSGTTDHNALTNRTMADQHNLASLTKGGVNYIPCGDSGIGTGHISYSGLSFSPSTGLNVESYASEAINTRYSTYQTSALGGYVGVSHNLWNTLGTSIPYAETLGGINSATAGSENGIWFISVRNNGTLENKFSVNNNGIIKGYGYTAATTRMLTVSPDGIFGSQTIPTGGSSNLTVVNRTATSATSATDQYVYYIGTTGTDSETIPTATGSGRVINYDNASLVLWNLTDGASTIHGLTTLTLNPGDTVRLVDAESGKWRVN